MSKGSGTELQPCDLSAKIRFLNAVAYSLSHLFQSMFLYRGFPLLLENARDQYVQKATLGAGSRWAEVGA